jgi:hypothetical protein
MTGVPANPAMPGRFLYVYDGGTCLGHIVNRGPAGEHIRHEAIGELQAQRG